VAGAAFIGQHTFTKNVGTGRPDANDIAMAKEYGKKVAEFINGSTSGKLNVKGNYPFVANGINVANPGGAVAYARIVTLESCTRCGLCAENCPWEAIDSENYEVIDYSKCQRCLRCIKVCPVDAKIIRNEEFFSVVSKFEAKFNSPRKEPELFLPE
jgi:ferredoxin